MKRRLIAAGLTFLLLTAGLAGTFVPEEQVPESLRGIHATLLGMRNSVIARSGLSVSRYEDSVLVENPGGMPLKIYFAPSPKMQERLCGFIESAHGTLDVCVYDLDLEDAADALLKAWQRNVKVRVIVDDGNAGMNAVRKLVKAGIPVRNDERESLMHNKFMVSDGRYVWTGSYNFTQTGSLKNDNNAVVADSPMLAAAYSDKFDEYWSGKFGVAALKRATDNRVMTGRIALEADFSPADRVQKKILEELDFVTKSVDIMAFAFTSDEIAKKLKELAKRGVEIRCLLGGGQAGSSFSKDDYLKGLGVKVRISKNRSGKMHHKVMILDGQTVLTGSYNYSKNAEKYNDENLLIIRDAQTAEVFGREFRRCWNGTKGY